MPFILDKTIRTSRNMYSCDKRKKKTPEGMDYEGLVCRLWINSYGCDCVGFVFGVCSPAPPPAIMQVALKWYVRYKSREGSRALGVVSYVTEPGSDTVSYGGNACSRASVRVHFFATGTAELSLSFLMPLVQQQWRLLLLFICHWHISSIVALALNAYWCSGSACSCFLYATGTVAERLLYVYVCHWYSGCDCSCFYMPLV